MNHVSFWQVSSSLCGCNGVFCDVYNCDTCICQKRHSFICTSWKKNSNNHDLFLQILKHDITMYHLLMQFFYMKDIHGLLLYLNYKNSDVTRTQCPRYIWSSVIVINFLKAPWNEMSVMFTDFLKAPQILCVMILFRSVIFSKLW